MAAASIGSGALFASLVTFAFWQDGGWTLRNLLPMGVALLVSAGCLAMGWGLLWEKRSLVIAGASVVIAILTVMFTRALLHAR